MINMCDYCFGKFSCKDFSIKGNKEKFLNCDIKTMKACHDIYFKDKPTELDL